jgi:hypothetical protein
MQHNTIHARAIMHYHGVKNKTMWTNTYQDQITIKCFIKDDDDRKVLKRLSDLNNDLVLNGYQTQITESPERSTLRRTSKTHKGTKGIIARVWKNKIST